MPSAARFVTGVFVGSHAVSTGDLTPRQLRSFRRVVQGVYADPALPFDHRLRCEAVALLLPPGAVLGGSSAAGWHGAPWPGPNDLVTVLRPAQVEWKGPRGVRVHRSAVDPGEIEVRDGIPLSTALRTCWDVAALEPLGTAVSALDAMVRAGAVSCQDLSASVCGGSGRWGVARVRRAVSLIDPRAESGPESRVRVALVTAGLAPRPQFEVRQGGRFIARVDLAFPEARLAVEYEGEHHFDGVQIVRDDERHARLIAAGWRVIRLSAADLRALDPVVQRVRAALIA
ncbi:endonuclease domain-containing protein [Geodermatophilus sp. SYSU D01180]